MLLTWEDPYETPLIVAAFMPAARIRKTFHRYIAHLENHVWLLEETQPGTWIATRMTKRRGQKPSLHHVAKTSSRIDGFSACEADAEALTQPAPKPPRSSAFRD